MNNSGKNSEYNSILILPNTLDSLTASRVYAEELAKKAGLKHIDCAKICLALEEAILNVITHSFGNYERATYEIVFRITESFFSMTVRDNGIPFHPEDTAPKCDYMHGNMDEYPDSGLGFAIMRNSVDQVIVRNHPAGKELYLIKYLPLVKDTIPGIWVTGKQ